MNTKYTPLILGISIILLFSSACGGAAATEEPAIPIAHFEPVPPAEPADEPAEEPFISGEPEMGPAPALSGRDETFTQSQPMAPSKSGNPKDDEPYDMFFEDYGVNPIIDTEDDHLSTFALDVDTGSYTVMRNYINDGYLPPEEAVRVEEYVNYFEQGYLSPPAHQAFGIYIDGAPSQALENNNMIEMPNIRGVYLVFIFLLLVRNLVCK